jgi:hypothetical protein
MFASRVSLLCRSLLTLTLACLWITALSAFPVLSTAAIETAPTPGPNAVDLSALARDLTLNRNADGRITMALWMPDEFWRATFQNSGRMTDRAITDYIAVVHPYTLVAVVDAQQGITAFRYTDPETLLNEVTLEDSHGAAYNALAPDSVSEEIRNLIQIMRPLLSSMLGALGQHMEFLVFPSADKAGRPIADPKSDGSLTVHLTNIALRYRLPLGSVLPPSMDPKTGESFPGSYHFNPYTGSKLVQRPSDNHARSTPKP